jgi:glycosyltransferase involved in cell wall biosynthesis
MNVVVGIDHRFFRTPDGAVWTQAAFPYSFWTRYLEGFEQVRVVARIRDVDQAPCDHIRADGPQISFSAVPYYIGPWQYLARSLAVARAARRAMGLHDAVILRVASQVGNCLFTHIRRQGRPYGVEVVGDPWDGLSPHTVRHVLRPILRRYCTLRLQQQCREACAASYVTERTLQERYPAPPGGFSTHYSSVELGRESYVANVPFDLGSRPGSMRIVFLGTLEQPYKGPDVLLEAVAACIHAGLDLRLCMIGDGRLRPELQRKAAALGLADRVEFRGQLPTGKAVRNELDKADLFVLPSRGGEGLPRAIIEAMARGLPCVATTVGGIPELLPMDALVPPADAAALAARLREFLLSPEKRRQMALRNLTRARDFHEDTLRSRRREFYRFLRDSTAGWLDRTSLAPSRKIHPISFVR